ncbi:MAG: adenylyltransferase [Candidatus Saccharibacteria bacterium]|nr:adenylyltransferase [Candidatus Saccharibacteria bacterium]
MTDATPFEPDYSDQTGFFNPDGFADTLTVIGCGGIGASILPTLVTMGFSRYVLWDDDGVEPRNIASNLIFAPGDLYRPKKVEVVKEYLLRYGATDVQIFPRRFTAKDHLDAGIVISGVDTMAARKEIWKAVKKSDVSLYLDGRIGGEHFTLLSVEPFDGDWYEKEWLFDDAAAADLPCTLRAVVYPAVALGAEMAALLAGWSRGDRGIPHRIDHHLGSNFYQAM